MLRKKIKNTLTNWARILRRAVLLKSNVVLEKLLVSNIFLLMRAHSFSTLQHYVCLTYLISRCVVRCVVVGDRTVRSSKQYCLLKVVISVKCSCWWVEFFVLFFLPSSHLLIFRKKERKKHCSHVFSPGVSSSVFFFLGNFLGLAFRYRLWAFW